MINELIKINKDTVDGETFDAIRVINNSSNWFVIYHECDIDNAIFFTSNQWKEFVEKIKELP